MARAKTATEEVDDEGHQGPPGNCSAKETANGEEGPQQPLKSAARDVARRDLEDGKEGQNVRLAAKLTGYKIDIKAE